MSDKRNLVQELNNLSGRLNLDNIERSLNFPKYFEIETFRGCNATCEMCTVSDWEGIGKMPMDMFKRIANEISEYSSWVDVICLSRNGEPLLDKQLEDRIKILKDYGMKRVLFSTNGQTLTEERSQKLLESGLDEIRFSIDGYTKETFDLIRRDLNYEKVIPNAERFIKMRDQYKNGLKPEIHVRFVTQKRNEHEEENWKNYWLSRVSIEKGDVVSSKPVHSWGNQLETYESTVLKERENSDLPCISPFSTMVIHYDGQVPLCGCDFNNTYLMGNVNESSLEDIWKSQPFNKVREVHKDGKRNDMPICVGCDIWDPLVKIKYER